MGKIQFVSSSENPFEAFPDGGPPIEEAAIRPIFGGEGLPELFEFRMGPNVPAEAHAHETDEIILVVEGSIVFGNRTLDRGSAVMIPAWTLYQFSAGPDGARLANFRPETPQRRIIPKDEFLAERRAHSDAATATADA